MATSIFPQFQFFRVTLPEQFIAHVEINRPEKLNAFHAPMWFELRDVFRSLSHKPEVRCVLISGAGDRAFTTGLDVQQASLGGILSNNAVDPARKANSLRRHILELQECVSMVSACEKPVIALMHGYTYGLGIDLATACDVRVCSGDTKFCVKEVDIGLAADVGTLSRLPKVVGGVTSWVKDVCFTARPFSPQEAMANGLVSSVVLGGKPQLMEEGMKMARLIAAKSPVAVNGTKNILDASWGMSVNDHLSYTAVWNAAMLQTTDVTRAMAAGLQKRNPKFEKL